MLFVAFRFVFVYFGRVWVVVGLSFVVAFMCQWGLAEKRVWRKRYIENGNEGLGCVWLSAERRSAFCERSGYSEKQRRT